MAAQRLKASSADTTSGSHAAATLTYAAPTDGRSHVIDDIYWSYSGTPTGRITITDGGTTIFDIDITAAGSGFLPFSSPLKGSANAALVITLADGGVGVVGKLNARHWTE